MEVDGEPIVGEILDVSCSTDDWALDGRTGAWRLDQNTICRRVDLHYFAGVRRDVGCVLLLPLLVSKVSLDMCSYAATVVAINAHGIA